MDEEKKLELRLGPPGEDWTQVKERREDHHHHSINSVLSLGSFPNVSKNTTANPCSGAKRGFFESQTEVFQHQKQQPGFLQLQAKAEAERKATAMHSSTQTRVVSTPVVGWPPIRSFRKNLASTSSSKPSIESPDGGLETTTKLENSKKGLFVKINMDGIPIGRKVDLKAFDSYETLSVAVDELFRDLLAAQSDATAAGTQKRADKKKTITGLLDGTGEYTLVYEDDEGDRMLVGDVPWEMFISMAKRLRVLKSSDLSKLPLGTINRRRTTTDC